MEGSSLEPKIPQNNLENKTIPNIEIETSYRDFVPQEFLDNPTAVKDLPVWKNEQGEELFTVGN